MRDFRDAKAMARALRDALKSKAIETTHAEALELIAKAFGYKNWNILSAKIEAAEPKPSNERWLSPSGTRHRHGERADPSQITRDYIAHPAGEGHRYQQRSFHWEKASIKVYLHGQSVDIAQGVVSTGNKGAGDQGIIHINVMSYGSLARQPNGKFVNGRIETRWHPLRHVPIIGFGKIIPDT
jgi:hypothetical protein